MKWIISLIWVAGLGLILTGGASYFNSGEMVATHPLSGSGSSASQIHLSPSMNPLRLLLKTRYQSITKSSRAHFYSYDVSIHSPSNPALFSKKNEHVITRKSGEVPANEKQVAKRQTHSLGTLDIPNEADYSWKASLHPKQSKVTHAELVFMANVETELPRTLWLGLGLIIVGLGLGLVCKGKNQAEV
jgi:hypothetical protein